MPAPDVPITFSTFQKRLLMHIRDLLSNGELTERGLARMVGVSQPHMHNVLKGVRELTTDVGDSLLGTLGLSLLELASSEELGAALEARREFAGGRRLVRLVQGEISPNQRFPDVTSAEDWVRLPSAMLASVKRPILTAFSPDPEMNTLFGSATHLIVDLDDAERLAVTPGSWYSLRWGGAGYIRQVRREAGALVVLGQRSWRPLHLPDRIPLGDLPLLSVIRGRVAWYGPDPRKAAAISSQGCYLAKTTLS